MGFCITRQEGQRIAVTGPNGAIVWLTVQAIHKGKIKLRIDGDPSLRVFREEFAGDGPPGLTFPKSRLEGATRS